MVLAPHITRFLDGHRVGVLGTVSRDGRPRLSTVYFARIDDRILVSTESSRWKAKDVDRTGWASMAVHGSSPPFPSVTVAGSAAILRRDIGEPTALVMQRLQGSERPPDPQTDDALAGVGRVILAIDVNQIGPVSYLQPGA